MQTKPVKPVSRFVNDMPGVNVDEPISFELTSRGRRTALRIAHKFDN